jgi:hypothetical protein
VRETEWDMTTRTDSIAGFYDDALIFDPTAKTSTSLMYKAYQEYCKESGLSAKSIHKFTPELIELCGIKLGLGVKGHRSNKGRSIIGLRFRSEGDVYAGSDGLKSDASQPLTPLLEQEVMVVSVVDTHSQDRVDKEEEKQMNVFEASQMMEELKASEKASGISSTNSSSTELESFTPFVTKQHPIAQPSPNDEEILPKGTKVHCERIDKDAVVYRSRRKEFKKPNGTTEIVLQYYVDLGGEVYKWFDWDLLVAV